MHKTATQDTAVVVVHARIACIGGMCSLYSHYTRFCTQHKLTFLVIVLHVYTLIVV